MSLDQPSMTAGAGKARPWGRRGLPALVLAGLIAALVVAVVLALLSRGGSSAATHGPSSTAQLFAPGRTAPAFALHDEHGKPLTLASLRGRPVLLTFIDPLCRDFCPREASVLSEAAAQLGGVKPAIVSVSVDPWANTAENFRQDALHWNLAPGWRWGVGSQAALARVWKDYGVAVITTKKKIAGVTVRNITHTGAAYIIDAKGDERALLLYPFTTADVVSAARSTLGSA